jgi:two-component system sensor histidine kinase KdpD
MDLGTSGANGTVVHEMRSQLRFRLTGVAVGALAIAVVSVAVELLDGYAPVLSLGALYLFAVLPIAVFWGTAYAIPVAVASMLAFNFLFLPPLYTFTLADSQNWVALAVYLVTAIVVSELAASARKRAAEAEQREREAAFLARASATLMESVHVQDELGGIASDLAPVLGVAECRIELGSHRRGGAHETALDLIVGQHHVGRLFLPHGASVDPGAAGRILPGLASLLAVAGDRERLGRRAIEAETLRRSDAVKTAILRTVSHDLRSPLTSIRASTEALTSPSLELTATDRSDLIEAIEIETKRLSRLVENLLDLSRLEVGGVSPRPEALTLEDLVGRALADLGEGAQRVLVSLPDELPPIHVDGAQVERVLVNLLENALKFSAPEDTVELRADAGDDEVLVRIVDHGSGLTEADLRRIFEPFEHGGQPPAKRGTGLGLAIARGFAQANGGVLWAESTPGQGGVFVLSVPTVSKQAKVHA